jgi:flagellar hook protein FlgE
MDVSFAAPVSGMQVSSFRLDVTAHNVANVDTPGFSEYRPVQTDVAPEGVRIASLTRVPNQDRVTSNTDLAEQMVALKTDKDTFTANAKVVKVKDQMLGTLLDMVG